MRPKQIDAFLDDLAKLTARHAVLIGGCEHCGCPWLDYWVSGVAKPGKYVVSTGDPNYVNEWHTLQYIVEDTEP